MTRTNYNKFVETITPFAFAIALTTCIYSIKTEKHEPYKTAPQKTYITNTKGDTVATCTMKNKTLCEIIQ